MLQQSILSEFTSFQLQFFQSIFSFLTLKHYELNNVTA